MLSSIENNINNILQRFPKIKKLIKRLYQVGMYTISPKIKSEGNIIRISPDDEYEYFFGYYDKSPWNINEEYMICLRAKQTYKETAPKETADVVLIDVKNDYKHRVINQTNAWNVQQGCMLQWLGPDFSNEIIFNDYRNGNYCSVIYNIETEKEKILKLPIYDITENGKYGLSLDFSRLHTIRPGYGYANIEDKTKNQLLPDSVAIWKVDLEENECVPLITYKDLYEFEHRNEMEEAIHAVNHIMINPSGNRFMFLHRWILNKKRYSRLITINIDGTEMYNLSDDDMVSHSYWKDDSTIISYARKHDVGNGYFLLKDKTQDYEYVLKEINVDGHPSYSPDGSMLITDTYPNRARVQSIILTQNNKVDVIGKVHAPFKYDNDNRCDLHPRWDRQNEKIAFDSVFEGKRKLYVVFID